MAEKLEDLNLPNAVVQRLIKEVIPDTYNISKEARIAVAKAASVFVLYITSASNHYAVQNNRKTINANDVLEGVKSANFTHLLSQLHESLDEFKRTQKEKKDASAAKKKKDKEKQENTETEEQANENPEEDIED